MSVMDETYRLKTYIDACTDHEMLLTSNPPKHRVTCTDVDIKPLIDAIESAYADDVMAAENRGYESGRNEGVASEYCMMLPKDADGEYINIGDCMECDGRVFDVIALSETQAFYTNKYCEILRADISTICHHKPPTVEDVLREFVFDACGDSTPEEAVVKRFAERLRLREED